MDFRVKQLPEDFHRRYDETTHKIYSRHLKRTGHVSAAKSLAAKCKDGDLFSFLLGFVFGLQYDHKQYGECYLNLRTAIVGLETVWAQMYMIFLPDLWGNFMISGQELIDISSQLYGNCQVQQFFVVAPTFLTYEGLSGLFTRTTVGMTYEVPLYYTKFSTATDQCIVGESAGKLAQLVLNYNI